MEGLQGLRRRGPKEPPPPGIRRGRYPLTGRAPVEKGAGGGGPPLPAGPGARPGAHFLSCLCSQSFPSTKRETMKQVT